MDEKPEELKTNWKMLSRLFKERYAYTTKIHTTIQTLERLRQHPNETFKEYYTHWATVEVMLKDKLSLEEMITKLLDGALPLYQRYMAIESYPDYNSVVQ